MYVGLSAWSVICHCEGGMKDCIVGNAPDWLGYTVFLCQKPSLCMRVIGQVDEGVIAELERKGINLGVEKGEYHTVGVNGPMYR
jgi:hypothetical protein